MIFCVIAKHIDVPFAVTALGHMLVWLVVDLDSIILQLISIVHAYTRSFFLSFANPGRTLCFLLIC